MKHYFTCITFTILWSAFAIAGVIRVPQDQTSIQAGINAAVNGDTVLVADNAYYENINFKGKAITVASHFCVDGDTNHINNTIIDGSQPSHPDSGSVVSFISGEDTNSVLIGFTITGGTGTIVVWLPDWPPFKDGAGVFVAYAGAKIENNKIINNNITATDADTWTSGAGITTTCDVGDYVIIRGNEISQNTATAVNGSLGAVGLATKETCVFENNRITNNVCNSNVTSFGGGLWIDGQLGWQGPYIIRNNVIRDNEAHAPDTRGGGMWISKASPEITNNTISNNSADGSGFGGGIYVKGSLANVKVMNTILWGNSATHGSEICVDSGSNIEVRYSDVQCAGIWPGEGNINDDPLLVADSLADASPCIGAGIDIYNFSDGLLVHCPPDDINGRARPYPAGSMPDIGAWESKLNSSTVEIEPQPVAEIPQRYTLHQNYPNPFNPGTTIEFDLPKSGWVTLKVFNILGAEVAAPVSKQLAAGQYRYVWDAGDLASGVYFYELKTAGFQQTKKLWLLR